MKIIMLYYGSWGRISITQNNKRAKSTKKHINLPFCLALLLLMVNTTIFAQKTSTEANPLLFLGEEKLLNHYSEYKDEEKIAKDNVNFSIFSLMDHNIFTGHAFSLLDYSYSDVVNLLSSMENWCFAVILNVNIKTCTHEYDAAGIKYLTFYVEDEHYVTPENAYHIRYRYEIIRQENSYFYLKMNAEEGPYDTGNYLFIVELIPLANNRSFIHLAYSAHFGWISRLLLNTYLATIGRRKFGFTVVGQNNAGQLKYIRGIQAIMERNTARYLLAFQAYLETLSVNPKDRFMAGLTQWHAYSELFKAQLYELNSADYIFNKKREFENQRHLQRTLLDN